MIQLVTAIFSAIPILWKVFKELQESTKVKPKDFVKEVDKAFENIRNQKTKKARIAAGRRIRAAIRKM